MTESLERLVGYLANRTDRLRDVLYQERGVLAPPPADASRAWGIGFYQGDEVLHKKHPLTEGESADWQRVGADLRTDCALLHLNQHVLGAYRTQDVGPFRFRRWSYSQIGAEDSTAFPAEELPDFLRRALHGTAASERVFHRILGHVHNFGALDHGQAPTEVVLSALRATAAEAARDRAAGPWAAVLTSGARTFGVGCGVPLYHVSRRGIFDPMVGEPVAEGSSKTAQLRYALLVAGPPEPPPAPFELVPADAIAIVERDLSFSVHSL